MDLTNEDVADILALLDSLPYDELDLRTSRFRLTLRRTPAGWSQDHQLTADPEILDTVSTEGGEPTESKGGAPYGGRPRAAQPGGTGGTGEGVGGSKGGEAPLGNTAL